MINALAILLACQLAGEVIARGLSLPVPGPVLGLAILLAGLFVARARGSTSPETIDGTDLGKVAGVLLASLGLLFVPAGAGVARHLDLVVQHGPALLAALVGSTLITLIVTVGVFRWVARTRERRP